MSDPIQQTADIGKEIDKHFSRHAWAYMLLVMLVLFLAIYGFNTLFQLPMKQKTAQIIDLNQRVELLEQRIETLEQQLKEQE